MARKQRFSNIHPHGRRDAILIEKRKKKKVKGNSNREKRSRRYSCHEKLMEERKEPVRELLKRFAIFFFKTLRSIC